MRYRAILGAALTAGLAWSCAALPPSAIEGVVRYEQTGEPVTGAFVVAYWIFHGADMVGSRSNCFDAAVVRTDKEGRYRIVEDDRAFGRVSRHLSAYQPGYRRVLKPPYDDPNMTLAPFEGSAKQRVESVREFNIISGCASSRDVPAMRRAMERARPLYRAIDAETTAADARHHTSFERGLDNLERFLDDFEKRKGEKE